MSSLMCPHNNTPTSNKQRFRRLTKTILVDKVINTIQNTKDGSSPEMNGIPYEFYKKHKMELAEILNTYITFVF
ncbi:hypothetical protein BB559_000373 [Furculomyces boomerangus]|uniref:Uncharacterized protein n=1 Tax=Furculomyces boomerangus TaxID=61424 RepID=A0A2T9Z5L6_9FUNG|nr:hypothetical protein BB559_000373 [Furculomyces boomerangus]